MVGRFSEVENRFVGQYRQVAEPGDRRNGGVGPGGDDEAPGGNSSIADLEPVAAGELCVAKDHFYAKATKPFGRIMWLDRFDRGLDRGARHRPTAAAPRCIGSSRDNRL